MENLVGRQFGKWTVISHIKGCHYLCKCECGTERDIASNHLLKGNTTSCGCGRKTIIPGMKIDRVTIIREVEKDGIYPQYECRCDCGKILIMKAYSLKNKCQKCCPDCKKLHIEDISGQKFGRLTAIRYVGQSKGKQTMWECKCDCGKTIIAQHQNIKNGHTSSCGCYNLECITKRNYTHGGGGTRLYRIWKDMLARCYKESHRGYKDYGGKGVYVCEEWKDNFVNFRDWSLNNGYSDELSIDRIDSNKEYSPSNCRWATLIEQANNTSRNLRFTIDGRTETLANWCRIYNVPYARVHSRVYARKWDIVKALTHPPQIHKKAEK